MSLWTIFPSIPNNESTTRHTHFTLDANRVGEKHNEKEISTLKISFANKWF